MFGSGIRLLSREISLDGNRRVTYEKKVQMLYVNRFPLHNYPHACKQVDCRTTIQIDRDHRGGRTSPVATLGQWMAAVRLINHVFLGVAYAYIVSSNPR